MALTTKDLETVSKGIGMFVAEYMEPILARIESLEAESAHFKNFGYQGVWRDGETFQRGNLVTDGGSLWHCQRDGVTSRPGTNGDDWKLCVKRGAAT